MIHESNSQKQNGLNALFKSKIKAVCLKMRPKPTFPTCVFDYRSGQMGTATDKNMNL